MLAAFQNNPTAFTILVVLAIIMALISIIASAAGKSAWPLVAVGLLLLSIAVLIGKSP